MAEKKAARPQKAASEAWISAHSRAPEALKAEYVAWLLDPDRQPRYQKDWADAHGVHEQTVSAWRHDDYVLALLKRANEMLEPVWARALATLVKIATDPDHISCVQAIREFGKLLGKYPAAKLEHSGRVDSTTTVEVVPVEWPKYDTGGKVIPFRRSA